MTIKVKEIKRYNATIIVKVNYGSIDRMYEYNGQRYIGPLGIAHFIEHMMFYKKDTTYYQEFDGIGSDINAYTTQNETVYTVSANKNNIYEALSLLLKMLFSEPDITDEMVQKEVSVISNEISQVNNKEANCLYQYVKDMYGVDINILGTVNSIKMISKDIILDIHDKFYSLDNSDVLIVGDVDKSKVNDLLTPYSKQLLVNRGTLCSRPHLLYTVEDSAYINLPWNGKIYNENDEPIHEYVSLGLTSGKLALVIGGSSTYKTTTTIQMAYNTDRIYLELLVEILCSNSRYGELISSVILGKIQDNYYLRITANSLGLFLLEKEFIGFLNSISARDVQLAFNTLYQKQLNKSIFLQDDSVSDIADDILASEIVDMVEFVECMKNNKEYLEIGFLEAVSEFTKSYIQHG